MPIDELKDKVIRALIDEHSIVRQNLPAEERLDKVVEFLYKRKSDATIGNLKTEEYGDIFKLMRLGRDKTIPLCHQLEPDDLGLSVDVFKALGKENNRLNDKLKREDLEVLCIIQNTLSFEKNRSLYLKNYSRGL